MKKQIFLLLIIFPLFVLQAWGDEDYERSKPSVPLYISITKTDLSQTGGDLPDKNTTVLKIEVLSKISAPHMTIEISCSGDLELVSGEGHWEGPVGKDEVVSITVLVKKTGPHKGIVRAGAGIDVSEDIRYSASDSYLFDAAKKRSTLNPPVKKDGKGRNIIEERL